MPKRLAASNQHVLVHLLLNERVNNLPIKRVSIIQDVDCNIVSRLPFHYAYAPCLFVSLKDVPIKF